MVSEKNVNRDLCNFKNNFSFCDIFTTAIKMPTYHFDLNDGFLLFNLQNDIFAANIYLS